MEIFYDDKFRIEEATAVTLGNFDGVHLGHQKLIGTVKEYAGRLSCKSLVFSFSPHPVLFFGNDFKCIFTEKEKEFVMKRMGVDYLVQYPFTADFARLTPEEFVELLCEKTNCKVLVVGEDYGFGKNRSGNYQTLKKICEKKGIEAIEIPVVNYGDERVSSTRIRGLLGEGDIEEVSAMLDKPYFIMDEVVEGKKRGRIMDYPTINLTPGDNKLLPKDGVYLSRIACEGKLMTAITNVGVKPTFGEKNRTVETHVFGLDESIYGKTVRVCFYKRLRDEIKFENIDMLKAQLSRDKEAALKLLEQMGEIEYKFNKYV